MNTSPLIYARRGLHGLSPNDILAENTYEAFENALKNNYDGIQLDLHLTKDNELIIIHDDTLNRTSNANKTIKVKDLNLRDIRKFKLKNGKEKYPLFKDILLLVKKYNKCIIIDVKTIKERALREIYKCLIKHKFPIEDAIILWHKNNTFINKYSKKLILYRAYYLDSLTENHIKYLNEYNFKGVSFKYTNNENNNKTIAMSLKYGLNINLWTELDRKKINIHELLCDHITI